MYNKRNTEFDRYWKWNMKKTNSLHHLAIYVMTGITPLMFTTPSWAIDSLVDASADHNSTSQTPAMPQTDSLSRTQSTKSSYDLFSDKLIELSQSAHDSKSSSAISGDKLTLHLGSSDLKNASDLILNLQKYRDAVEKQCKTTDDSSQLLVNTLDHCLVKGILYPSLSKSSVDINQIKLELSQSALNTCRSELAAYFREKEKRTDVTEKELFIADKAAASALEKVFEVFGSKTIKEDLSVGDSSDLVKGVKAVKYEDLCQVKLEKTDSTEPQELDGDTSTSLPKKDPSSSFSSNQNQSEYEEYEEETIEEEETFIPLKPKAIVIEEKPVYKPEPKPAPQPRVEAPKPTYQPVPYQPAPIPPKKPQKFEPVPPKKNNVPFIPAARPAPRRAVVAGPPPVGGVGPLPFAGPFGLSLGFSSFNSNVETPIIPPPMPPIPPMPMPIPVPVMGGMGGMGMGGGSLIGVSSGPRACLACGTTAVTPMPTLGLATMLARPCQPVVGQVRTQPVGACLPNMNQPVLGFGGINPNVIQVPRIVPGSTPITPGTPVVTPPPSTTPSLNPTIGQPVIGAGGIAPSRTSVPRVGTASALKRAQRGSVRSKRGARTQLRRSR